MKNNWCPVCNILGVLIIIGALNWGLVGVLNVDLVAKVLGPMTIASRIVYILVGIAGVMKLVCCIKECPTCKKPA